MFLVYTTVTVVSTGGDSASGLSTLSHTKICTSYVPDSVGVHDCAGFRACPGASDPVIHDSE